MLYYTIIHISIYDYTVTYYAYSMPTQSTLCDRARGPPGVVIFTIITIVILNIIIIVIIIIITIIIIILLLMIIL